jgi:hypothetical protein
MPSSGHLSILHRFLSLIATILGLSTFFSVVISIVTSPNGFPASAAIVTWYGGMIASCDATTAKLSNPKIANIHLVIFNPPHRTLYGHK